MVAPRLEIKLEKIHHNAKALISRLSHHGISVTGITKAALGSAEVVNTLIRAGINSLGDSRIETIKAMRLMSNTVLPNDVSIMLIRSPMLSQAADVVMYADMSCNTEIEVIKKLSSEAQKQGCTHEVLLMIELGDLREGIMPNDLVDTVREVLQLPNIILKGTGTNLACRSGVSPSTINMGKLSALVSLVEKTFGISMDIVSGGNSSNIQWALDNSTADTGRINNLRLGEAILLGREPLQRLAIKGLYTNAFTLIAEVIESKLKPSQPTGELAQSAFGSIEPAIDRGMLQQAILAIGIQDVDPSGLECPEGINILGASSDHLVIESTKDKLLVGEEIKFQLNYSALVRSMTSPFVTKIYS